MQKARLGFIGAGWWATSNHMPILKQRDDVEFVGVCRKGADELRAVEQQFGFAFATEDHNELLDKRELDAVVVASPHTLHFEHARAAMERGLHVMCEKPMCTQAGHARELVRLADEKNLHLVVPYGWHHKPFVQQAKKLLDDGGVGAIEYVLCHMASPLRHLLAPHPQPLSRQPEQLQDESRAGGRGVGVRAFFAPDPKTWADPQVAGGGYGHAQISHSSGLLFWLTTLRARSVFARMTAPEAKVELYDAMSVEFTSGAIGTVSGAGTVPRNGPMYQVDLRIFGSEGMLLLDCERARMELHRDDGEHTVLDLEPQAGAYECSGPPNNFVDLVLGKTQINRSPGEAAMRSVELLDAAYRSAASGRVESVDIGVPL